MKKKTEWLSHAECSALRGLAIIGIVLHNYCHWLDKAVKENEYQFNIGNSRRLWQALMHPDGLLPVDLVSYFGHYGVPVFVFLSGYGLVLKYEQSGGGLPAWPFLKRQYTKLFGMMIFGLAAFMIFDAITPGSFPYHAGNIIAQLTMTINFLPYPNSIIWPGPYWFFGLMMQYYIVWRLFIFRRHWRVMAAMVAVCWMAQAVCEPDGWALNQLRYNCIGNMMPFCAGVMLARIQPKDAICRLRHCHWAALAVASAAIVTGACFWFHTWLWAPAAVIFCAIATVKALPAMAAKGLAWVGGISAALFVTHPILRKAFIGISRQGDTYDGIVIYAVTALAVAYLFNRLIITRKQPQ